MCFHKDDPVALLPRLQVAAELFEHDRQSGFSTLAQILDLGPPLPERIAVLAPAVLVIQSEPAGLGVDPLDEEGQAVARPGDLVQRVGRLGDHRRVVVRLPLEHLRQALEGEVAEVVGNTETALTPCPSPGTDRRLVGRGEILAGR